MQSAKKLHIKTSIRVLQGIIVGICLILIFTLFKMQIIDYDEYNPRSQNNALRREYIDPTRGQIIDRNGKTMVSNIPIFSITVTPADFKPESLPLLASLINIPQNEIQALIDQGLKENRLRPVKIISDIDFETYSRVQENIWRLQGVSHLIESKRSYPYDVNGAHIFGYLSEVTKEELKEFGEAYRLGDISGKSGIELVYEKSLRGSLGTTLIRVSSKGRPLGPYQNGTHDTAPVKGSDITTSIDRDLQILAEKLMQHKIGGLVAMDPQNGEILAMVSAPQFDLNKLTGKIDRQYWSDINNDRSRPLFNRAISSRQPPASTFKPIMGLIGLDLGLINKDTRIFCAGGFSKGRLYRCTGSHGSVNLEEALLFSCNTYFFSLMDKIGTRKRFLDWKRRANDLGLGIKNGIDIPQETSGIIPDSAYFNRAFGVGRWGLGDLINLGVGQGVLSVSPLQVAVMTATIANGGYWVQPHVVRSITESDGSQTKTVPEKRKVEWITPEILEPVRTGMYRVVQEGAGRQYVRIDTVKAAGKTGTAQNPHGRDHGWFVGFAPFDRPKIVVAVIIENAGSGQSAASPIAGLLIEQYIQGKIKRTGLAEEISNLNPYQQRKIDTDGLD